MAETFYSRQAKCRNHTTRVATKGSKELGDPLCWQCDPLWRPKAEKQPRHIRNSSQKGKRYDKLPSNIANLYEITVQDQQLISLHEDIATTEAIIQQIGLDLKDNPWDNRSFFKAFWENWDRWERQVRTGAMTTDVFFERVAAMRDSVLPKTLLMSEFLQFTEQKRKLVETEANRLNKLGYTPDYVSMVLAVMGQLVTKYLSPADLTRYDTELKNHPIFNKEGTVRLLPADTGEMTTEEKLDVIETEEYEGAFQLVEIVTEAEG
jgi:hypothetical protein